MKYTIIVSVLILIAVLLPGSNIPEVGLGGLDKVVHLIMFGVWAIAVRYDYDTRYSFVIFWFAGLLFSVTTELLQIAIEGRNFDVYDIAADTIGLTLGLLVSKVVVNFIKKLKH